MITDNETEVQQYIRELITMVGHYARQAQIDGQNQADYKNNYAILKARLYRFASIPENCL